MSPVTTPTPVRTPIPETAPDPNPDRRLEPERVCPSQKSRIGRTIRRVLP